MTQRLVNFCLNDDELSLVIGHELAHQAMGHLIRGAAHQELGQFLGAAFTAFSTLSLSHLLDWRHAMVSPEVRGVASDAVVSVFSRDDEREADIYGAWYAFQAGYNIDKGSAVWERMAAVVDHDPFESTYFLDSHPAALERLATLRKVARYFQAGRAAEVFLQAQGLNRQPAPDEVAFSGQLSAFSQINQPRPTCQFRHRLNVHGRRPPLKNESTEGGSRTAPTRTFRLKPAATNNQLGIS